MWRRFRGLNTPAGWVVFSVSLLWIGAASFLAWTYWPDFMAHGESPSEVVRNVGLTALGPIALLVALWRSTIAARQAEAAVAEQVGNRWQRAVDALDSGSVRCRKAAMRLMQLIADAHPEYRDEALVTIDSVAFSSAATDDEKTVASDVIRRLTQGSHREDGGLDPTVAVGEAAPKGTRG